MMKKRIVIWLGLALMLTILMAACSGTSPTPQSEEPGYVEGLVSEEPVAVEEEPVSKVSVTLNSSVHSSDLGGYAWIQEFLSTNDFEAADAQSWSESARAGAECYTSIAPSSKSAPSGADGTFSITFEAEPGSTFQIMCDPDETHPSSLSIDVFTVPDAGGTIDHATAGFLYPGLWTPESGIANELAAQAAGYANAEEMFQSAGTCRALALPGEGATIALSDGDAYGFYMEAPDTAGRVTMLTDSAGAYIVVKEFEADESEAEIDIDFTDTSGAELTWPTVTCPIKKGFSTHLEVLPGATQETAVLFFGTTDEVEGSSAILAENGDGYDLLINTAGLTPGNAVTVCWAIYNFPDKCSGGVCDQDDDSLASFKFADGQVIEDSSGKAEFESHISGNAVWEGAEIQFMIRDHGPVIPDMVDDQTSTAGGGCSNFESKTGPNECADVQAGSFAQS